LLLGRRCRSNALPTADEAGPPNLMKSTDNLLIVADSEHDANMLYAVGMFVPDPFIYLRVRGRSYVVMSDLEIDRARRQAPHCRVVSLSRCQHKLRDKGRQPPGLPAVIRLLLREKHARRVLVPHDFPYGLALELQRLGVRLKTVPGSFFAQREIKSPDEVRKLTAALRIAEAGMAAGIHLLKSARIKRDRRLWHAGKPLTSETLRSVIDTAVLQAGGQASHTIVAGGRQGCDPHESGHGPLRAHEPIILDIFPRAQRTGYFGDITRTVVRGRASEPLRKLYHTVWMGQQIAFNKVRPGSPTAEVHTAVQDFFQREGYQTGRVNGRMQGFFHGTGHGLGLEIHEAPRLGTTSSGRLQPGHVVTVEPGLYYPDLGGVRLEDVASVTHRGARNLTLFEKVLEI
jgi:Xaa-Pro aminopeptidase